MREIDPGHLYGLANLKGDGETLLPFYKDPAIHATGQDGPSCQEVLRVLIARVAYLESEKPHSCNPLIIGHLRAALALFECRALLRKAEKGLPVERLVLGADGHFKIEEQP